MKSNTDKIYLSSGTISEETVDYIKSLDMNIECDTHLFARNEYVDDCNRDFF